MSSPVVVRFQTVYEGLVNLANHMQEVVRRLAGTLVVKFETTPTVTAVQSTTFEVKPMALSATGGLVTLVMRKDDYGQGVVVASNWTAQFLDRV